MSTTTGVDFLANITIACCTFVLIAVYSSIALSPPWDDGTGFPIFNSHFETSVDVNHLQFVKEQLIPESAKDWAANLTVEITPSSSSSSSFFVVDVFDTKAELGKHHVMKVKLCNHNNKKFCICDSPVFEQSIKPLLRWNDDSETAESVRCVPNDERKQHEFKQVFPDRHQTAVLFRYAALKRAEQIESEAFDRLVIRLRHYFETNAGIDSLFRSIFYHQQIQVEEAPIEARHGVVIVQPRLPPKTDKTMKLNFAVAENDSRWVHDLGKDPHANALTHAPFVFPMFLIFVSCLMRLLKGCVMKLRGERVSK